jgi:hypothetical protein
VAAPLPAPAPKKKEAAPKKIVDPLDTVEPDPVFKNKAEKIAHDDKVRNEGLKLLMFKPKGKSADQLETDLEIEEPGAANSVAEEGAKTIQSESEYADLITALSAARAKKENHMGKGGFKIELKDPRDFENTMRVVVMTDALENESKIKAEKFDTKDQAQTQSGAMAMAMTLQTEVGATIVDDQPGKESIIQNFNSDQSKITSQISSGYSIRNNFVQKMAPGDKQFHLVSWDEKKKFNNMRTFQKRSDAEIGYMGLGKATKILVSGETGDVLYSNGKQNMVD